MKCSPAPVPPRNSGERWTTPEDPSSRILLVCPSWGELCGIASYTARLRQGLAAVGVRADVARNASEVQVAGAGDGAGPGYAGVGVQFEYGLYRRDQAEPAALAAALAGLHLPVCVTMHGVNAQGRGHRSLNAAVRDMADVVVTHSRAARREWERAVHHAGTAAVIPMGCPPPRCLGSGSGRAACQATRWEMGFGPDDFVVGFFGFAAAHKGIANLVRAIAQVPGACGFVAASTHPRNPGAVDDIRRDLGLGPLRPGNGAGYRPAAPSGGRPEAPAGGTDSRVRLVHEWIPDEAFGRYLDAVDVLVLPYSRLNRTQSTSMMATEALASGRPVIATKVGYLSGLGDAALRIEDNRPETIAAAITAIRDSPWLGETLVRRASRLAARASWPAVARRYLDLLGSVSRVRTRPVEVLGRGDPNEGPLP